MKTFSHVQIFSKENLFFLHFTHENYTFLHKYNTSVKYSLLSPFYYFH